MGPPGTGGRPALTSFLGKTLGTLPQPSCWNKTALPSLLSRSSQQSCGESAACGDSAGIWERWVAQSPASDMGNLFPSVIALRIGRKRGRESKQPPPRVAHQALASV